LEFEKAAVQNSIPMKNSIVTVFFIASAILLFGQEPVRPYNESSDTKADLKTAIALAKKENKHVLVQFGGNWCPWCIRFHSMVKNVPVMDSLIKADYIYVLANVPREKEKRDYQLFQEYDYPNRFGYPVFVILDGNGKKLHIQDSGILENCTEKGYDTTKVVTFLRQWNVKALDPGTYLKK
jgi:thioredoxin-related protein